MLVEKMVKACLIEGADNTDVEVFTGISKVVLRVVLKAIQDGDVAQIKADIDKNGWVVTKVGLTAEYQKFLESGA